MVNNILKGVALTLIIVFMIIGLVLLLDWMGVFDPTEKRDLDSFGHRLLEDITNEMANKIPKVDQVLTIYVPILENDPSREKAKVGHITQYLADALDNSGSFEAVFTYNDLSEKQMAKLQSLARRKGEGPDPRTWLANVAKITKADGVIDLTNAPGSFRRNKNGDRMAIDLQVKLFNRHKMEYDEVVQTVRGKKAYKDNNFYYFQTYMHATSWFWRLIIWLLWTTMFPFLTWKLVEIVVAKQSNSANGYLIGAYTLLSGLLALILVGFWFPSMWSTMSVVMAFLFGGIANFLLVEFIHDLTQ